MAVNAEEYKEVLAELDGHVQLVAVSKTRPAEEILVLYALGQRDFGENYVQELVDKQGQLPADIRWHFIGHLQSNKVKYLAPFVYLIHGVDSLKLLKEIDRQAARNGRCIDVLLQVHIAREETKFGLDAGELEDIMRSGTEGSETGGHGSKTGGHGSNSPDASGGLLIGGAGVLKNVRIRGLMGMASFVHDTDPEKVRVEFRGLKALFDKYFRAMGQQADPVAPGGLSGGPWLSMGMSGDYKMAIEEGSNMVRIGSLLFGKRS